MIINGIEYIGVCKEFPKDIKYFNEGFLCDSILIDDYTKDLKELISISINIESNILKILPTPIKVISKGKELIGKKILIQLNLNYKIKYISHSVKEKNIYFLNKSTIKSNFLILPEKINNITLEELIKKNEFIVKTYIEYIYAKIKNNREIIVNTAFVLNGIVRNILKDIYNTSN